jgi:TetR/AcrR family transcriptional regulator
MKETSTESHIKYTAKKVFFGQGKINAKMHEIAKEAGLNRALLHYYFRNRENLFEVVMKEAMEESFLEMFRILATGDPFEKKTEKAIHHIIDVLAEFPFMESFIISEINKDPLNAPNLVPVKEGKHFTQKFLKEIKLHIRKKKLPYITPEHFIVNMMALCAYPSSTKPIIRNILGFGEKDYQKFLHERKKLVTKIILGKK